MTFFFYCFHIPQQCDYSVNRFQSLSNGLHDKSRNRQKTVVRGCDIITIRECHAHVCYNHYIFAVIVTGLRVKVFREQYNNCTPPCI